MKKQYRVFHNKLAGFLMYKGFVLQGTEISNNSGDRKMNLYIFNDSEQLQNAINEFKELHKK